MKRVLFVCTGNVCRSPMAEGLFREMVKGREDVEVESAGIGAMDGQKASTHSLEVLRDMGIDISRKRSNMLTPDAVRRATHIFGMTSSHKQAVETLFPAAAEKTFLLREFLGGSAMGAEHEVPDPIGLGRDAYEKTCELIKEALPSVLEFVEKT